MYVDTHAHLYSDQFKDDLDLVVKRCIDVDVRKVLLPNIDSDTVEGMFGLCDSYPDLFYPMVGLHPCSVKEDYKKELDKLEAYLSDDRVIAIGEIGTDLYWDKSFIDQQKDALGIQISWAKAQSLPIVLHCRDSLDITIDIIEEAQDGHLTGVFHCFGGTIEQAKRIIDLGFYIGIGGVSTFKKSGGIREMIGNVALSNILLETDAPYLSPHPNRGKRNESSYIPLIGSIVAESHAVDIEVVAKVTTENVLKLFGI